MSNLNVYCLNVKFKYEWKFWLRMSDCFCLAPRSAGVWSANPLSIEKVEKTESEIQLFPSNPQILFWLTPQFYTSFSFFLM